MTNVIIDVTETCYDEIRKKLVAQGDGGTIVESGLDRRIDMTGVTVRTHKAQLPHHTVVGNKPTRPF